MLLHHFTSEDCVHDLLELGISDGQVRVALGFSLNAAWLTVDPVFSNQRWDEGDRSCSEVRIDIEIPGIDGSLMHWPSLAKELQYTPQEYEEVNCGCDPNHWYVYFGTLPPCWFKRVCFKEGKTYTVLPK